MATHCGDEAGPQQDRTGRHTLERCCVERWTTWSANCVDTLTHTQITIIYRILYYYPTAATGIAIAIGRTRIEVVTVIIVLIE